MIKIDPEIIDLRLERLKRLDDMIYLAGFFDGEGCIHIRMQSKFIFSLRVCVSQKQEEVLEDFKTIFSGGFISGGRKLSSGKKSSYRFETINKYAAEMLMELLPFLRKKKKQAELAVLFYESSLLDKRELTKKINQLNEGTWKSGTSVVLNRYFN